MLKSICYSITFPTTGRSFSGQFDFQKGFGAIVGPNEAGKSLLIEIVRFCLFGAKALRGKSEDYKTLKAELVFAVRGVDHKVVRSASQARLVRGSEVIAVGTKPVNLKVVELLGFGLDVFDVACVANQGDIEKLGAMLPAERKRMVDSVIGLGVIDEMAKWCGEEALGLEKQAEGIERTIHQPVLPATPAGYRFSAELEVELEAVQAFKAELDHLRGWLSQTRQEPTLPVCDITETAEDLKVLADRQRLVQVLRAELKRLPPPSPFSLEDLDRIEAGIAAYEAWQARQQFLRMHPEPQWTREQLDYRERWDQKRHYEAVRADYLTAGYHRCPACDHTWPVHDDWIKDLDHAIIELGKLVGPPMVPEEVNVEREHRLLADWEAHADEWQVLKDIPEADRPQHDRKALTTMRASLVADERRRRMEAQIAELGLPETDYTGLYQRRLAYEIALDRHVEDMQRYSEWLREAHQKKAEAAELEEIVERLPALKAALQIAHAYEKEQQTYLTLEARYREAREEIDRLQQEAIKWRTGKGAMIALRGLVKQHLLPSLNRVASHLIKEMTGGQRQTIVVDEDFDVTVDGQPLNTLSGSGKAVANLALRIGLGQVLTNNVFSVFMGDEIDASMDENRSEKTSNTLRILTKSISQILVITHKFPSADYYIELGRDCEELAGTVD